MQLSSALPAKWQIQVGDFIYLSADVECVRTLNVRTRAKVRDEDLQLLSPNE
jgi:hypothetical protein